MTVLGQYGVERWDADGDRFDLPPTPDGITHVQQELPGLLAGLGLTAYGSRTRGGRSASTPASWPTRAGVRPAGASRCASWRSGTS